MNVYAQILLSISWCFTFLFCYRATQHWIKQNSSSYCCFLLADDWAEFDCSPLLSLSLSISSFSLHFIISVFFSFIVRPIWWMYMYKYYFQLADVLFFLLSCRATQLWIKQNSSRQKWNVREILYSFEEVFSTDLIKIWIKLKLMLVV